MKIGEITEVCHKPLTLPTNMKIGEITEVCHKPLSLHTNMTLGEITEDVKIDEYGLSTSTFYPNSFFIFFQFQFSDSNVKIDEYGWSTSIFYSNLFFIFFQFQIPMLKSMNMAGVRQLFIPIYFSYSFNFRFQC